MSRFILLSALFAASCGDCKGDDTIGRPHDRVAPEIVAVSPADAATDVDVAALITATFSESIDPATLGPASFVVSNASGAIPGTVQWDEPSLTATFTPDNALTRAATCSALLSTGVTDLAGNSLAADHAWGFVTAASTSDELGAVTQATHGWLHFAVNDAGRVLALWEVRNGAGSRTLYAFFDHATGTWSAENVLDLPGGVVDVVSNGTTFLAVSRLYSRGLYAVIHDGTSWRAPEQLSTGLVEPGPMVTNGSGYAVGWSRSQQVHVSIFDGTWSDTNLTESTSGAANSLDIASNGSGYAALWRQTDNTRFNLHGRIFDGTWSARADLETSDDPVEAYVPGPTLASDGSSYAALWDQGGLVHANRFDGAAWSGAEAIDANSNAEDYLSVVSTGSGYAAIWRQRDDATTPAFRRTYATFYDAGTWSAAAPIDAGNADSSTLRLARAGAGIQAVWREGSVATGIYTDLRASRASNNGGWSWSVDPEPLDTGTNAINGVELACSSTTCVAIWTQGDALYANVAAATDWSGEVLLEQGTQLQSQALVATASGAVAGWHFGGGAQAANVYTRELDSGVWAQRSALARGTYPGSSEQPTLATNTAGVTVATWRQYDLGSERLFAAVHEDDVWGAPFLASAGSPETVQIAAGDTDIVILWTEASDVWTATWDGALGAPQQVNDVSEESARPQLVWTAGGAVVIWASEDDTLNTLLQKTHDGSDWGAAETVYSGNDFVDSHRVAAGSAGHAVVWVQADDVKARVHHGTAWSPATTLDVFDGPIAEGPVIAAGDSGYAVVWIQSDGNYENVYASIFDGTDWTTAQALDSNDEQPREPTVAACDAGFVASWVQYDVNYERSFANLHDGSEWTGALPLSEETGDARAPRVAGGGDSFALLWLQESLTDPTHHDLLLRRHDAAGWSAASVVLEPTTSDRRQAFVTFNRASFSAAWIEQDPTDTILWHVRARLGF